MSEAAGLAAFEARLGRPFRRKKLLQLALTHASVREAGADEASNERLEFLGDRVLGLVVAEHLFEHFPDLGESGMAPRLNTLVNRAACARAARRCGLGEMLRLSKAEAAAGGRDRESILADACEALIAALYLDGGLKAARDFILRFWAEEFAAAGEAPRDPKSVLQEWAAARKRGVPAYVVLSREGPDHAPSFLVEAMVEGLPPARARGSSKRDAERAAADALLRSIGL